jgi:tripartite-type tricarboxylate transporter receptor subunit TctC
MFPTLPASIEYIRAGKLRPLAVTTATRSDALLDISIVGEFVPGYEASSWYGIGAPRNTPAEIVEKLNKESNDKSNPYQSGMTRGALRGTNLE